MTSISTRKTTKYPLSDGTQPYRRKFPISAINIIVQRTLPSYTMEVTLMKARKPSNSNSQRKQKSSQLSNILIH